MGNYEIIVKIEEIRKKVEEGDLQSAQKILDTIDLKKVKNTSDLSLMAEVFRENEHYDKAEELYFKIYQKNKTRKTTWQLVDIFIKQNKAEEAEDFLSRYDEITRGDFDSHVFRYKLDKIKGFPYEKLIHTLETLNKVEYTEKWAYELAKLYYKAGKEQECMKECSNIVLWFGEGVYVEKAKMLRSYYSGEAGKEKFMEELRRRTMYSSSEIIAEQETENFEKELKKDIQNILTTELTSTSQEEESALLNPPLEVMEEENPPSEEEMINNIIEEYKINPYDIFGDYLNNEALKVQLVNCLKKLLQQKELLFITVEGKESMGKTTLAKAIALFLSKAGRIQSSKLAKITAEKLNTVDLIEKAETLKSCCLLVEHAGKLSRATIEGLLQLYQDLQGDFAVILEDVEEDMKNLINELDGIKDLHKSCIFLT